MSDMKKSIIPLGAGVVSIVLLLYLMGPAGPSMLQSPRVISGFPSWSEFLDPKLNAYFTWRSSLWSTQPSFLLQLSVHALFFAAGIVAVTGVSIPSIIFASLIASSCGILWGSQPIVLHTIVWIPAVIWCRLQTARPHVQLRIVHLAVGIGIAVSANQLGIVAIIFSLISAAFVKREEDRSPLINTFMSILLLALPSLLVLAYAPSPYFPHYPQGTQVVPDDEIPGMLRPFMGPLPPVPVINRWEVREYFLLPSLIGAFWMSAILVFQRRYITSNQLLIGICLGLLPLLDTAFPEPVSVIAPIQVLPRLIPGIFFFPLIGIALGSLFIASSLYLLVRKNSAEGLVLLILGWVGIWCTSDFRSSTSSGSFSQSSLESRRDQRLVSPSHFVVKHYGEWILTREKIIRAASFVPLKSSEVKLSASHNSSHINRVLIDKPSARWTARGGVQRGNEWIIIKLSSPRSLEGIELDLGPYFTDFPRGVRVSSLTDCSIMNDREVAKRGGEKEVINLPDWRGAIEFTEDGYPFFRGRFDVKIYFPETVVTSCLLIEQTALVEGADWSVHTLALFESPPESTTIK